MAAAHSGACAWRYVSAVATQATRRHPLASAPDRGGDGAEREPARRRRADAEAASEGRPVRRPRDPHAGRACGADRPLARRREPAPAGRRAGARLDAGESQSGAGARPAWAGRQKRWSCWTRFSHAEPDGLGHWNLKAATLGRLGDFEEAIASTRGAASGHPSSRGCWLSYGHMLKTIGRLAEGVTAYRKAIELEPTLGEAWWSLANLKTVKFDDGDIAAMREALEASEPRATRTAFISILRWARRCTMPAEPTRRSRIIRPATRCGCKSQPYIAARNQRRSSTVASRYSPRRRSPAPGGCEAPRSDLHRRHAARRIDTDRADPVVAQPGRRHNRASRHAGARAQAGHLSERHGRSVGR